MTKPKAWGLLAVAIVVVVLAAGWFLVLSPQKSKVSSLNASTAQEQQLNQRLQEKIATLKKEADQKTANLAEISEVQGRIPSDPELTTYVRTLSTLALGAKVQLISVSPAEPKQVTAAPAPGNTGTAPASPSPAAANLSSITMSVDVNGSYDAVHDFLAALETTQRVTVVSSVDVQPGQPIKPAVETQATPTATASPKPTWQTLDTQITLAVFMAPAPGSAASTAPAAPGTAPN